MKLSNKIFLPIILISALLILLNGCFLTPSEEQPEYTPTLYTVTYDGNGSTSGAVPTDPFSPYVEDATVKVLANTGKLFKSGGFTFAGWDTAKDGTGTYCFPGDTFKMGTANVTLYAQWATSPGATTTTVTTATGGGGVGGTVTPTPAPIQLTIADPTLTLSKPYDGTTTAAVTAGVLSGVVSGDTVTVSAAANYDLAAVGTGKTITVVYTLAGADAAKYIKPVDYSVATGEITAANIGDIGPAGGIVFYDKENYSNGWRYLEAAPSDQSTSAKWGCLGTSISGADGTNIGTGNQNTIDIMAGCSTSGIAARLCANLELNGYDDWFLPSKDELNKLYVSKDLIGGFTDSGSQTRYWSSSEYDASHAWYQKFRNGSPYHHFSKDHTFRARAVRTF